MLEKKSSKQSWCPINMSLFHLKVCRLCASSCENSVPILRKTGAVDFVEKIKSYIHVEIKTLNNGNYEPRMCDDCYKKIINWDQYVEQVQKVQGMFMSLTDMVDNKMEKSEQNISPQDECKKFTDGSSVIKQPKNDNITTSQKKSPIKKVKQKKTKEDENTQSNSDFSEEDDIPLANHLDGSVDGSKNKVKVKSTKKAKPRIRLKEEVVENSSETLENGQNGFDEYDEDDDDDDDENDDSDSDTKDENKMKLAGLQATFTWECLECHAPVKNWNALVKHCKDIHDSNASVQCICGKFLQSRASIMKHRMKHTIGYGYKCEFENCNKTFHRQQLLDIHSLSHMPKELQPWMCCKCSRRFHTESLLKQHEKVHLPKEEKLIHPCEVCQKKFCSKSAVTAHIRAVHFGERPFVCDQCGHSFTSKGILHEHLTIHSDVYNFHCKDCNKSFKTKYRLKIHMDTHMETKYQCPICTLTLNTRRTLRMHLLVHKEDKAFQCTTCGKAFKRSKDLKNHYNLHTGRRPYTCPFCQRTFANGSNCRSHKRRMHPEELRMYEAALAAGQQPPIFRTDDQQPNEHVTQPGAHFLDDSNESNVSNRKHSDEDDKVIALVPHKWNAAKSDNKVMSPGPLNLESNKKIKEESEGENVQGFASQTQNAQYPVQNLYAFQSSGIPAFPGNPFFRQ